MSIPELPGHPNSVFTKDTAVYTPKGYIRLRMGLPSREGEEQWMAEVLDEIGIPCCGVIEPPGTAEGGDIILAEKVVFLGLSSRTNASGINQLAGILKPMGFEIRRMHLPSPFLHIGGTMTLVAPDTVLCVNEIFPDNFFNGFQQIRVPHAGFISGNVIPLGNNQVIADRSNRFAIKSLQNHKYHIHALNLSEFIKGTGGPSCLTLST